MKKIISIILVALLILSFAGCAKNATNTASSTAAPATAADTAADTAAPEAVATPTGSAAATTPEFTIKVGHTLQEGTPAGKAWVIFKDEVEKNSNGRIVVELYPNSSLGSERVMFESCQMGTLEVAYGTTSVLANFDKDFGVLDLPFLFSSETAARAAMTGELGEVVAKNLNAVNLVCLTYMENGIRNITNNVRPINTPDDLKGLKIRTMENSVHMSAFTKLGASPTPMAFTELFTALQQKTVDGQENPLFLIQSSRFEEVQKYLSLTGHFYTSGIATINLDFWNSLPVDLQTVVMNAGVTARDAEYQLCDEQNATALEYLKTKMEVNEITPENRQLFIDATAPVYDEVKADLGEDLVNVAIAARDAKN